MNLTVVCSHREDDIQIMQNYGLAYKVDDHSKWNKKATLLTSQVNAEITIVSGRGVVGKNTDIDVFKFNGGVGKMFITVSPAIPSANLDIKAQLYNENNQLVAQSSPITLLSAKIVFNIKQKQTYYLKILGTGVGDPLITGYSDYGSLGEYFISGEIPSYIEDTDGDGMPDDWEIEHGSNPLLADADADADNDGYSNIEEYRAEKTPKLDTDNDGMFDAWEMEHGFDINVMDCPSWVCRVNSMGGWRSIFYQQ